MTSPTATCSRAHEAQINTLRRIVFRALVVGGLAVGGEHALPYLQGLTLTGNHDAIARHVHTMAANVTYAQELQHAIATEPDRARAVQLERELDLLELPDSARERLLRSNEPH